VFVGGKTSKMSLFLMSLSGSLCGIADCVGAKLCKKMMSILCETETTDTELLVYTMTLINKVQHFSMFGLFSSILCALVSSGCALCCSGCVAG